MPTALELTRDGWKPYLEGARRHLADFQVEPFVQRERERLIEKVRQAAAILKRRFGARRVLLFGSLAHPPWFRADSDVDLAVEGLRAKDYWTAWQTVEDFIKDRPVDFIEIEAAGRSLQQAIRHYGVEL
jgi:predicted nucleotidyltransferase